MEEEVLEHLYLPQGAVTGMDLEGLIVRGDHVSLTAFTFQVQDVPLQKVE